MFNDFRDELPPLRLPRKVKVKVIYTSKYDLKQLYFNARKVMYAREYPNCPYYDNKFPDITTTNGTQRYINDVLNNVGHFSERINTMGIPVSDGRGGIKWRRSGSTKGSPDIHCVINSKAWMIEVKKGNDDLNPAQEKYKKKMASAGVPHTVIHVGNLDYFWDELNRILKL